MAFCVMLDQGTVIFYKDDRCINRGPAVLIHSVLYVHSVFVSVALHSKA